MKVISGNWILTSNKNNSIIENGAVVYDEKIIDVDTIGNISKKFPSLKIPEIKKNSVIMPGLINTHVHLEFSSNKTTLKYGNFVKWLYSVIEKREKLAQKPSEKEIDKQLKIIKKTGTTTIGAISSYSSDLKSCLLSKLNVVYFCEVMGSKPDMVDTLFVNLKARINEAMKNKSKNFIPALAIHSPYSTHPILVRECLKIAKKNNFIVSAHFLESIEEKEWLSSSSGGLSKFFKDFFNQSKSLCNEKEFLEQFKDIEKLLFTHCVQADNFDLDKIKNMNASIIHCPTSNRLLLNEKLNLENLKKKKIDYTIGTDGLSSNISLSMFDEMRNAIMIHENFDINEFSTELIDAVTKNAAKALGLKKGMIEKNYDSDLIILELPDELEEKESLAQFIILHTKYVKETLIGGESV